MTRDPAAPPVPIIDLGLARSIGAGSSEERGALAAACRTSGVFYVRNHGVAEGQLAHVAGLFDAFFELPIAERCAIEVSEGESCGYEALDRGRGEFNDSFHCVGGAELFDQLGDVPRPNANKWPERPAGLEHAVDAYMRAMHGLGVAVMSALALSLDLEPDHFVPLLGPAHAGSLRARRYPPQRLSPGSPGAAAHTDGPPLAFILQSGAQGLETYQPGIGFVPLPNVPGTIVCQLGEVFSRWTNDRYVPNLHRIVNADPEVERRSIIYWLPIQLGAVIECVPTCRIEGESPHHPPITFQAYLLEWIASLPA